jgi:hypothetical protein
VRSVRGLGGAGLLACALLAACSTQQAQPPRGPAPDLDASITQFRHEEGTRNLRAGVTNLGDTTVTVTGAMIDWVGFESTSVDLEPWTLSPGDTAGFSMEYGDARCENAPTTQPHLRVVVDGVQRRLPLRVEDPELFERLYQKECAARRLANAGSVTLQLADAPIVVDGEEYLPGAIVILRKPGSTAEITIVDLGGSVLLRLTPRSGPGELPARLEPGRDALRLPVLVGSAHRCDAHALGNSSQTFLLSAYVRLDQEPVQRVLTVPDARSKERLTALILRDCR